MAQSALLDKDHGSMLQQETRPESSNMVSAVEVTRDGVECVIGKGGSLLG
jgi:hypothetical protein